MKNEHFIEKVIKQRKALDISQETMGEWLDVTPITVSQIESGNTEPDITMCLTLAEKLNIPVEEIFSCGKKRTRYNKVLVILAVLMVFLVMVNVAVDLFGKNEMRFDSNKCYIVTAIGDEYVELKERAPSVYNEKPPIYKVHRDQNEDDIWSGVASGDVVIVWYRSGLLADGENSSDKIIRLKIANQLKVY